MPQAEALNLLAITLMLGMSPSSPSTATQAATAQQRPRLEAMQVRDHIKMQDRSRAVISTESTNITTPSADSPNADPIVPAVAAVVPESH